MADKRTLARLLTGIARNTEAGVTTIATLALPVIIGAAGLGFDLNRGYQQRIINQRAADMAALGAAMAYARDTDVPDAAAFLSNTAEDIALTNGLPEGADIAVDAALETDPATGGDIVRVQVERDLPFALASVLGFSGNFTVRATSLAALGGGSAPGFASPCYLALDSGSDAIRVNGGAQITAPACAVAAVGDINNTGPLIEASDIISGEGDIILSWGEYIANTLRFGGEFDKPSWNNKAPPEEDWVNQSTTLTDPWMADPELQGGMAIFDSFPSITPTAIAGPSVPTGTDVNFKAWESSPIPGATKDGSTFILPQGDYNFRDLRANGGTSVRFADGSTVTVSNTFDPGGGMHFGDSDVYVARDFTTGWGTVSIGDGTLYIGGNGTFNDFSKGAGDVTVAGRMTLNGEVSFGDGDFRVNELALGGGAHILTGRGDIQVNGGLSVAGGSTFETGDGNVSIGKNGSGMAIYVGGGSGVFFGDGTFTADGDIHTSGGTAIIFGATDNHYVNGDMHIEGAAIFGKGRYNVNGWFKNGTGGASWPRTGVISGATLGSEVEGINTSPYEMVGVDVTFLTRDGYTLAGDADTRLEASPVSADGAIGELLFASFSDNDIDWGAGSTSIMSGSLYFPNAKVEMSGGNSTTSPSGGCLSMVAKKFFVDGGGFTGSACNVMAGAIDGAEEDGAVRLIG